MGSITTVNRLHIGYIEQLDELYEQIEADFQYYRKQNSEIDKRLNELGKRGRPELTADEMEQLLIQRRQVKDVALKLLPLRDFFRNHYAEVGERIEKLEAFNR
ncbi:hypothetical protein MHB50_11370 [Siminovitchia sp. FSL H7-0308]|uniref:Uncharacterized protein n=1 Tax=Siminovitchia thermophila TaxID=1245522 RepID=A0ABS2RES5_9BACI|nr:hypothetical protein [Siminovitchia thermophila]MBM7717684.1 hypothetical protein [Siminovitchia thermophila]ONK24365.1 hypothetical protein BLX87_05480 [Bacillus sp. VT-16-64]